MTRVEAGRLGRLMRAALAARGLAEEHAGYVAEGLLSASLRGIDTHGVRLFATYLAELDGGRARARPELAWVGEGDAAVTLDAGGALGLVAGRVATAEVVRRAHAHGVGAVLVRNSNHFGAASVYTLEMARHEVVGLAFTNSDALVAPFAGRAPLVGTNPLSVAAPGEGDDTFCADLATSQVSYSRVKAHRAGGEPLEAGWAVDAAGRDLAEGGAGELAALKPLGGHKGQALGMAVEVLTALLAGEPLDHELSHLYEPPYDAPRRVAHLFLGLDASAFGDPAALRRRVSALLAATRGQPAVPGERVMAPGDPEAEAAADRTRHGIPLAEPELSAFARLAVEHDPDLHRELCVGGSHTV